MQNNVSLLGKRKERSEREFRVHRGSGEVGIKPEDVLLIGTNKVARIGLGLCSPLPLQLLTCLVVFAFAVNKTTHRRLGHSAQYGAWH